MDTFVLLAARSGTARGGGSAACAAASNPMTAMDTPGDDESDWMARLQVADHICCVVCECRWCRPLAASIRGLGFSF